MRESFLELIEKACAIKFFLMTSGFEVNHYEDGSYVDFHVIKVVNLPRLLELAGPLELRFHDDENGIRIRMFENYSE